MKKANRIETILNIGVCLFLAFIIVMFVALAHDDGITPDDFYSRKNRVSVETEAEAIKETIRPVVAQVIPEGFRIVDDFVVISWHTPYCFCNYWVLVQSSDEMKVITFDFPETGDSMLYYRFLTGEVSTLPKVSLSSSTNEDGKIEYHLHLANEANLS